MHYNYDKKPQNSQKERIGDWVGTLLFLTACAWAVFGIILPGVIFVAVGMWLVALEMIGWIL